MPENRPRITEPALFAAMDRFYISLARSGDMDAGINAFALAFALQYLTQ